MMMDETNMLRENGANSPPSSPFVILCYFLAIIFTLASLAKFGKTSDGLFISHHHMTRFYDHVTPKLNKEAGTSFDSELLRHGIGYFELACMLLLMSPLRLLGVFMGVGLASFTLYLHIANHDYSSEFIIHLCLLASCVFALYLSRFKPRKSDFKKN